MKLNEHINSFGLIDEAPRSTDYIHGQEEVLGGSTWEKKRKIVDMVVDWSNSSPEDELQKKGGVETNACVSFSVDKVISYLINDLIKVDAGLKTLLETQGMIKNGLFNPSDRRTAKGSGTDPNVGNTVRAVDDYIRNSLFCPEDMWPFPEGMTREQYYAVMPGDVADYGKKIKPLLDIETKYLPTSPSNMYGQNSTPGQVWEGLQYSPIWVSVDGYYDVDSDGLVTGEMKLGEIGYAPRTYNHRVLVRKGVYGKFWEVHDNYLNQIVKFKWNYLFGGCKIIKVEKKTLTNPFVQVGASISFLASGGQLKGQYVGVENGTTLKAVWGDYDKAIPKINLDELPVNHSGKTLTIK
jgi:hypothetical protein